MALEEAATVICVLGPSRSGTSLTTRLLNLAGVYLGSPDELLGKDLHQLADGGISVLARAGEANSEGFWEHYRLMRLNERILRRLGGSWRDPPALPPGWEGLEELAPEREEARALLAEGFQGHPLWGWKDPRNCLTLPFWQRVVPEMRYVVCLRNPIDVAASLAARDGMPPERGIHLCLAYVAAALAHTSGRPRLLMRYESYFDDPHRAAARLARFAGRRDAFEGAEARGQLAKAVDGRLWRNRSAPRGVLSDGQVPVEGISRRLSSGLLGSLSAELADGVDAGMVRDLEVASDVYARRLLDRCAKPPASRNRELHVWFAGSPDLAQRLSSSSRIALEALGPDEWGRHLRAGERPHFVLVEGCERTCSTWHGRLEALLGRCELAAIPRLLWITSSPFDPKRLARAARFDRAFTVDREQLPSLSEAGFDAPSPLWEATSLRAGETPTGDDGERPDPVVWLGGWSREWPEPWRERLAGVLRGAAELGLAIVPEGDMDGLPSELQPYVELRAGADRMQTLRQAKVAIGADPLNGALRFAPQVVFDAAACGTAVVSAHDFAYYAAFSARVEGEFRHFIPTVADAGSSAAAIDRFLSDDALRVEAAMRCRQIVRRNHTYSHRLATLASAVGVRMLPE